MPNLDVASATGTLGAITATATARAEFYTVVLTSPIGGANVSPNPRLTFTIQTNRTGSNETNWVVEVSGNAGFTAILFTTTLVRSGAISPAQTENVDTSGLVLGQTYYWRVRGYSAEVPNNAAWVSSSFVVVLAIRDTSVYLDVNIGQNHIVSPDGSIGMEFHPGIQDQPDPAGYYSINLNIGPQFPATANSRSYMWEADVNTDTPAPYIWWIKPASSRPDEGVKIVGLGFGDLQATFDGKVIMSIEGEEVTASILSWQTYPPSANAYTGSRIIDRDSMTIDPQHTIIEFLVPPEAVEPGHLLWVRTDGP